MRALVEVFDAGSRSLSLLLSGLVAILVAVTVGSSMSMADALEWARRIFGPTYITLLTLLVLAALYSLQRMRVQPERPLWLEAGMQAASGITTLSLTYTLMGISLGIGTLAEQALTPETVQEIIGELTAKFSLAFMTTVVGLPIAAVLRTLLMLTHARRES